MLPQIFWLKSTTTWTGQKRHLSQAVFSVCLLSRDARNARIKWYGFRQSSRHCAFKTLMKWIYLARKKWGWQNEKYHVSTFNWEVRCGLFASLLLWSGTPTFPFPLPPSCHPTCLAEKNYEKAPWWFLPGCHCHLVI